MDSVYSLENFLKMLYLDSNIPSYIYNCKENRILYAQPEQSALTYPPKKYISRLRENTDKIAYMSAEYGIYYGCLNVFFNRDWRLLFGPVSLTPYSDSEIHQLCIDYVVPQEERQAFSEFMHKIPQLPLNGFLLKLIFINFYVNQEILSLADIIALKPFEQIEKSTDRLYEQKTYAIHNNSYEVEKIFAEIIRTGNTDALSRIPFNESLVHAGITGPTALRQIKNNIIITTTIATRAAIEGGLDSDTAFQLSDDFIQTAEKLTDPDTLNELMGKINYTFAEKVRNAQMPVSTDGMIQNAIRFIQQNVCEHITVADVAEHVGFSRSYFSSYFKKELGFSVSAFILRCKMEEAKQLLKNTDKSVSVISSYLCFSSQSHFQSAFKKQYGITPLQYRRNPVQHEQ